MGEVSLKVQSLKVQSSIPIAIGIKVSNSEVYSLRAGNWPNKIFKRFKLTQIRKLV